MTDRHNEWVGMTEGDMIVDIVERRLEEMSLHELLDAARLEVYRQYAEKDPESVREEFHRDFLVDNEGVE